MKCTINKFIDIISLQLNQNFNDTNYDMNYFDSVIRFRYFDILKYRIKEFYIMRFF